MRDVGSRAKDKSDISDEESVKKKDRCEKFKMMCNRVPGCMTCECNLSVV